MWAAFDDQWPESGTLVVVKGKNIEIALAYWDYVKGGNGLEVLWFDENDFLIDIDGEWHTWYAIPDWV
jgi:hypothetical protein